MNFNTMWEAYVNGSIEWGYPWMSHISIVVLIVVLNKLAQIASKLFLMLPI